MKRVIALFIIFIIFAACGPSRSEGLLGADSETSATATPPSLQNIQIDQAEVLPPYGVRVSADVAALTLRLSSTQAHTPDRLEAIRAAIEQISDVAATDDAVSLQDVSVSRVGDGSERREDVPYFGERYDSSSAILTLSTSLADHNDNLLESLIAFNTFLSGLNLSETITIETLSIEAEISNPESYREQLIAKVYQELEAVQEDYGPSVKFEITGLHGQIQIIPLTDTEFYLYLDPAIIVKEF